MRKLWAHARNGGAAHGGLFCLTDNYNEGIYEQIFFLKYNAGWSFSEAYSLPVGLRNWFVQRTIKQLEMEAEAIENASNGKVNHRH